MKIGVRAHDYGRHDVKEYAKLLHEEGYDTVQLAIPKAFNGVERYEDITDALLYEIRDAFAAEQVEIAVLGCYMDLGNPKEEVREYAVKTFCDCLRYSKILGAKVTGSETAYPHLSKLEKQQWFPTMMDSLKLLRDEAEYLGVNMAIEPVAWHPLTDVETTLEVLKQLDSNRVKIIFDPANVMERPAEVVQSAYWKRCFETLGDYIEAIHLKDFEVDEAGNYIATLLGEGCMEYTELENWLKTHPDMPVLREEMNIAHAKRELEFMRQMQQRAGGKERI